AAIAPADAVLAFATASPVSRGGVVGLDGSKSFSRIKSWEWSFAPGSGCPAGLKLDSVVERGERVSFAVACSFRATLTVSDGQQEDRAAIDVDVLPRSWKTEVVNAGEAKLFEKLTVLAQPLGRNVNSYDGVDTGHSGHILHRGFAPKQTRGYEPARIVGGPFDGAWIVNDPTVNIKRTSLISVDLYPDSDLWAYNVKHGRGADFKALAASVRDHEQLHTTLIAEAVARSDPLAEVEKVVAPSLGGLIKSADDELRAAETRLQEATSEANVKARMTKWGTRAVSVYLRDASTASGFTTTPIPLPPLAEIGDAPGPSRSVSP